MEIWPFCTAVYARPGVEAACLDLQDRRGLDVGAALFVLWAGTVCGRWYGRPDIDAISDVAFLWQTEVIGAIRLVRRKLKSGPPPAPGPDIEGLRTTLREAELQAERLIIEKLARDSGLVPGAVRYPMAGSHNLNLLIHHVDTIDEAAIDTLVTAAAA